MQIYNDVQDTDSIKLAQDAHGFVALQDGSPFSVADMECIEF